jgi:dihydrofolate reductase
MIVAIGENRQIGLNNKMLWHISSEFKHFKKMTMGKTMIMGRKTFESIGRPLPGRTTLILSRNKDYNFEGCDTVTSIDEAIANVKLRGEDELVVCGGAQIYEKYLPEINTLHLTIVDYNGDADTFFPEYNKYEWKEIEKVEYIATDKDPAWTYYHLERI